MKIPDSGKNADTVNDFREYGGTIFTDKQFSFYTGRLGNPCDSGAVVEFTEAGIAYYHSHPSGEKKMGDCYYIQGPSLKDQQALTIKNYIGTNKKKMQGPLGYVFGMNKRSHLIYIYDKHGLQATIPFSSLLYNTVNK